MESNFVDGLKELARYYFCDSCLEPKRIAGRVLKGKDLLRYFEV